MQRYTCVKCNGRGKIHLRLTANQVEKLCRACYGHGRVDLERAAETLAVTRNSFEREFDNEPLGACAFETLDLAQLESAVRTAAFQPDLIDCESTRLMLSRSRGGPSLNIFRVADDQYALMLVTSTSKFDEGRHYIQNAYSVTSSLNQISDGPC